MNFYSWIQSIFYLVVLLRIGKAAWLVHGEGLSGRAHLSGPMLRPVERFIYRLAGVNPIRI